MKIAFLCSSLAQGRDGVGDYTRRLAGELVRQGHSSVIVGLNDPQIREVVFESQIIENVSISVLRLPGTMPWNKRMVESRKWLDNFNPDWVSLQFVPFGFNRRGLCFGLGKRLAATNIKASWHIMFHELWLGLAEKSSAKHRVWGTLQQRIIMDLVGRLRPQIVHTHVEPYRKVLHRKGIKTSILPLFSNIQLVNGDAWEDFLEPLLNQVSGKHKNRSELYLAGVFGMVHPEWNAEQSINALLGLVRRFRKRLVVVFFGKSNLTPEALGKLKFSFQNRADAIMVGERTTTEISKILQSLDLGLATTPRQIIQKSGSVAAMLEHGLPVLVTRDDWRLRGDDTPEDRVSTRLLSIEQFLLLEALPTRKSRPPEKHGVELVASRMLEMMKTRGHVQ
jgi:hypothetical protein